MAGSKAKTFFKFSCLGCLGVVFVFLAVVGVYGWISGSNAKFAEAGASYAPEQIGAGLTTDLVEASAEFPERPVNRVNLVVSGVDDVEIGPCEADEGLAVEAKYNEEHVAFSESWGQETDGSWTYTVEMTGKGFRLMRLIEQIFNRVEDTLNVCLPADAPVALDLQLEGGGLEGELGGLWLTTVDLGLDSAGAVIGFSSPLREPVDAITVAAGKGGVVLHGIGNASPAILSVDYEFAGLTFEMGGEWKQDSQIDLEGFASGVSLVVPRSVHIEGVPHLSPLPGVDPETSPTLFFAPGIDYDDVKVRRR